MAQPPRACPESYWRELTDAELPHYLQQIRYALTLWPELATDVQEDTVEYLAWQLQQGERERQWRLRARRQLRLGTLPARFDDLTKRAICDAIDLCEYFHAECGTTFSRPSARGARYARCPFCGSGGAFYVYPARPDRPQWFYCQACGRHGDAINAYILTRNVPFVAALVELSALVGLPLPRRYQPAPPVPPARPAQLPRQRPAGPVPAFRRRA